MQIVEAVLVMIAACLGFAVLAKRLRVPYAALLVVGGMVLALLPGVPTIALDPELALAFFLPPLLQASAYRTDWRSFRSNLRPILLLAVGCVIFSAVVVGGVAKLLIPDLPWAAAIALGAIVAPPDAAAAASVLQTLRLPRRLVTLLEGESLINDASALVLYRLAVVAVATGSVTPWGAAASFVLVAAGGVAVGVVVGRLTLWLLRHLDDAVLITAMSFLVCYAAFLAAEAVHVSGVIAVVTLGLMLGQAQHRTLTPSARLAATTTWQFIEFVLNSLVFILIGLQLNGILDRLQAWSSWELAGLATAVAGTLILARFAWIFPVSWASRLIPAVRRVDPMPRWSHLTVLSWAGMRGVVSLAAALALPEGFPSRDLIIFLAFMAILATLVVQGTTLEWLICRLGVTLPAHDGGVDPEEAEGRRVAAQASLAVIQGWLDDPLEGAIAADLVPEFRDRAGHLDRTASNRAAAAAERTSRRRLRLLALDAGRDGLLRHHAAGHLSDEALGRLMHELDLEETRVRQVLGDTIGVSDRQRVRAAAAAGATPLLGRLRALLPARRAATAAE